MTTPTVTPRVDREGFLISTTAEHPAVRLGRALEKAYAGTVRFGVSQKDKLVHVWWVRQD